MPTTAPELDQRDRIVETARTLMSEVGSHAMSMRSLAAACELNVATIYHYFPSKADLLRSVIRDRHYPEQIASDEPPVDPALPPRERLAGLLLWLLHEGFAEQRTWRLLVGETLRGEAAARDEARGLLDVLDDALASWLRAHFPELDADVGMAARLLRNQLIACFVEDLVRDSVAQRSRFAERADDLASVLFA